MYDKQRSASATLDTTFTVPKITFKGPKAGPSVLAVKDAKGKPGVYLSLPGCTYRVPGCTERSPWMYSALSLGVLTVRLGVLRHRAGRGRTCRTQGGAGLVQRAERAGRAGGG